MRTESVECPSCGHDSACVYRCEECGHDLAKSGQATSSRMESDS